MRALPPDPRAHHLVKFVWLQARVENISMRKLCDGAGVSYNTFKDAIRCKSNISADSLEALLNYVGYSSKPTPLAEALKFRKGDK